MESSEKVVCIDGSLAHHWIVEAAGGGKRTLGAYCRRCEASRTFEATLDVNPWDMEQAHRPERDLTAPIAKVNF